MFVLVSPAVASWLPHGVNHTLHNNNIEYLSTGSHNHSPHAHHHDNNDSVNLSDHHQIHLDDTTYFSDQLNIDVKKTRQTPLVFSDFDLYGVNCTVVASIKPHHLYDLPPSKSRIPLNWNIFSSGHIPPYLSTQRLQI
ncbi:MAG: hypothetical protein ACJAUP_000372 [Cellvibrionaceae bacterium]|jgi:hypothetical protein